MPAPHLTLTPWQPPALPALPTGDPYPAAQAHSGEDCRCKECPQCTALHIAMIKADGSSTMAVAAASVSG